MVPTIIALAYWIPSTIYLFSDSNTGSCTFLIPGCILGFAFGYGSGNGAAFFGQIITLVILILIGRVLYEPFRKKKTNEPQSDTQQ